MLFHEINSKLIKPKTRACRCFSRFRIPQTVYPATAYFAAAAAAAAAQAGNGSPIAASYPFGCTPFSPTNGLAGPGVVGSPTTGFSFIDYPSASAGVVQPQHLHQQQQQQHLVAGGLHAASGYPTAYHDPTGGYAAFAATAGLPIGGYLIAAGPGHDPASAPNGCFATGPGGQFATAAHHQQAVVSAAALTPYQQQQQHPTLSYQQ